MPSLNMGPFMLFLGRSEFLETFVSAAEKFYWLEERTIFLRLMMY